jgi:3-deoxy-manno-octulosonate cytidylyltransferase (CMP-KDO synthetase)
MRTLIVVPARFGSSRLPGKPLAEIAGQSMVSRVAGLARRAAEEAGSATYVVATDDTRILEHCRDRGLQVVMTDPALPSGSDRALAAAEGLGVSPEFIVNLQGDAPFTPAAHVTAVIETLIAVKEAGAATPYIRLSWDALDRLRAHKRGSPFSGTTLTTGPDGRALWFSKTILPAMRKEAELRRLAPQSPVCQHIGLYGYRHEALRKFCALPESRYERLEGLEQLRLIEAGIRVQAVEVQPGPIAIPGIDTAEDLALAERLVAEAGDPETA